MSTPNQWRLNNTFNLGNGNLSRLFQSGDAQARPNIVAGACWSSTMMALSKKPLNNLYEALARVETYFAKASWRQGLKHSPTWHLKAAAMTKTKKTRVVTVMTVVTVVTTLI